MTTPNAPHNAKLSDVARMDAIHEDRAQRHDQRGRWRVERAGGFGPGKYCPGWFALRASGSYWPSSGAYFGSWVEAMRFVDEMSALTGSEPTA